MCSRGWQLTTRAALAESILGAGEARGRDFRLRANHSCPLFFSSLFKPRFLCSGVHSRDHEPQADLCWEWVCWKWNCLDITSLWCTFTKKMFTQTNSLHPRHPQVTRPGGLVCGRGVLENEMEFPRGSGSALVLSLSSPGPSGKVGMPMRPRGNPDQPPGLSSGKIAARIIVNY